MLQRGVTQNDPNFLKKCLTWHVKHIKKYVGYLRYESLNPTELKRVIDKKIRPPLPNLSEGKQISKGQIS